MLLLILLTPSSVVWSVCLSLVFCSQCSRWTSPSSNLDAAAAASSSSVSCLLRIERAAASLWSQSVPMLCSRLFELQSRKIARSQEPKKQRSALQYHERTLCFIRFALTHSLTHSFAHCSPSKTTDRRHFLSRKVDVEMNRYLFTPSLTDNTDWTVNERVALKL